MQARSEDAQLDEARAKLERAVAANGRGPLRREVLLAEWISAEDAEAAAKAEWKRKVDDPQSEELDQNRTLTRAAGVWHEIVTFLQSGIPASGRLTVEHDIESGPILAHRGVSARDRGWIDAPTLMLDATAEPEIISALMGMEPTRLTRIYAAEPMLKIRQDPSRSGAKSMLLEAKGASASGNRAARRKMVRLTQYVLRLGVTDACRLLVISNKDVIAQLAPALPENVVTAHFGALRGLNDFEGIDQVVVIGRWMPAEYAVNARTAALFGVPVVGKLNTGGTAPRLARDRDGYYWHDGRAAVHIDQRADLVLRAIRDAEIEQAIGRVRAVNASTPVDVILLSDAFVRQPVEIAALWVSILKDDPVLDMIDAGGVAFLSPSHAAEVYPLLWASKQAAQYALVGLKTTGQKTSYIGLYEEFCPVDYRTPKRAEVHKAFVDLRQHAVPVDAVSLLLPRVTEVRLAKPETVKEAVGDRPAQCNILPFLRGGAIDLNLALTAEDSADDTIENSSAGACVTPIREQPENTIAHVRRPDGGADGDNAHVKGSIPVQALPAPPRAAVIVALPARPYTELSWPADATDDDDICVAPHMSIHGAELLIFRREPAEQAWDRARRAALWAGADHPRKAGGSLR